MPYRDQARYPPLSTVPPPNLNTHVPAAPPSYSFIPFAQQQGFDWFRLQSEEFQLAQQQSFVLFEEFPFLLRNNVLIGAKCTLVCFLIIALQMRRFFTLKMSLLSFSQICLFFFFSFQPTVDHQLILGHNKPRRMSFRVLITI